VKPVWQMMLSASTEPGEDTGFGVAGAGRHKSVAMRRYLQTSDPLLCAGQRLDSVGTAAQGASRECRLSGGPVS